MKKKLLRVFALLVCVCMVFTCQISAGNANEGIMPLWTNTLSASCNIIFMTTGQGGAVADVSSIHEGSLISARLTLYRVRFLLSDVVVDFWAMKDYDVVNFGETFTPDDGQKYKLVLEATISYGGYDEPITLDDTKTYRAGS